MSLYFHELIHLCLSLLVGFFIWKCFRTSLSVLFASLLGGFFIDIDHIFDYIMAFGMKLNLFYFFKGYAFLKSDKIYIPLHSWELAIILLCISFFYYFRTTNSTNSTNLTNSTKQALILAFSLSLFLHLSTDVGVDNVKVQSYSILYRASNNFDLKKLVTPEHYQKHLLQKTHIKL
jgi:hypothetical protein